MATCLDCAKIAYAAYFTGKNQYYETPPGHMVDGWHVQHWETGGFFGNGFQGGIWQSDSDVVIGCCGTNTKQKGKFLQDIYADIKIGLGIVPNQVKSATKMVRNARQIAHGRRLYIVGHSLGGGLAQVVGARQNIPFVTFNAPAMKFMAKMVNLGAFSVPVPERLVAPGVNFRIRGMGLDGMIRNDRVSIHRYGAVGSNHIGTVVDLPAASSTGAHGKNTCWQAVLATDWAFIDPFGS